MTGKFADCRVTVDLMALKEGPDKSLSVLLIQRGHAPFQGMYALPGGFLDEEDASLEEAACRELLEETNVQVKPDRIYNFGTYGDRGRDPRGRTVTGAFLILLNKLELQELNIKAGDDAREAAFFAIDKLPNLAFDHAKVIADGLAYLAMREKA